MQSMGRLPIQLLILLATCVLVCCNRNDGKADTAPEQPAPAPPSNDAGAATGAIRR